MPGQPEGEFDVTKLEAIEKEPSGGEHPSYIFDYGESFQLQATFQGSGTQWENMKLNKFAYVAQFFAEGMGPGVADRDFGTTSGNLASGQDVYEVRSPNVSINAMGIFRCIVVVTFRGPGTPPKPWIGFLGFNEDCVIQVHVYEEFG